MADKKGQERFLKRFGDANTSELIEPIKDFQQYSLKKFAVQNQHNMTIRFNALDAENWLPIDWTYPIYHEARSNLLERDISQVIQYWNNGILEDVINAACKETLEKVVEYLLIAYPEFFSKSGSIIHNKITHETYNLKESKMKPLEIAARLVNEDLNILLPLQRFDTDSPVFDDKGEPIYDLHLVASATLFPAGWALKERIGWTIQDIHKHVPEWHKRLGRAVPNALKKIAFGTSPAGKPAVDCERLSVFPQADQPDKTLGELLYARDGKHFYPASLRPMRVEHMIFRRERQCFRRLEGVNGVLFSVRTYVSYLDGMDASEVCELTRQVLMLPEYHAAYKQLDIWYTCLRDYCVGLGINIEKLEAETTAAKKECKNFF